MPGSGCTSPWVISTLPVDPWAVRILYAIAADWSVEALLRTWVIPLGFVNPEVKDAHVTSSRAVQPKIQTVLAATVVIPVIETLYGEAGELYPEMDWATSTSQVFAPAV